MTNATPMSINQITERITTIRELRAAAKASGNLDADTLNNVVPLLEQLFTDTRKVMKADDSTLETLEGQLVAATLAGRISKSLSASPAMSGYNQAYEQGLLLGFALGIVLATGNIGQGTIPPSA